MATSAPTITVSTPTAVKAKTAISNPEPTATVIFKDGAEIPTALTAYIQVQNVRTSHIDRTKLEKPLGSINISPEAPNDRTGPNERKFVFHGLKIQEPGEYQWVITLSKDGGDSLEMDWCGYSTTFDCTE